MRAIYSFFKKWRIQPCGSEALVCEKYLKKGKDVYLAFLDLEKAYNRVDREAMWNVLRLYGVGGKLLKAVRSLYVGSKAN